MSVLLHGSLMVTVNEARNLPNMDKALFFNKNDKSDPYVTLEVGQTKLLRTAVILDDLNPKWMEKFRVDIASDASELVFHIKDKDVAGSQSLGFVRIKAEKVLAGQVGPEWFDVVDSKGKKNGGKLNVGIQYATIEQLAKSPELPDTYFDMTSDNRVTLYQDAHTPSTPLLRSITLSDGRRYRPTCAWYDVYEALKGAQRLIYITGWSVYTQITLIRDDVNRGEMLGDLLKAKANEGVRVLILVWDERFSTDMTAGLLGTHDNETAIYFKGTGVEVILVPRQKRHSAGIIDGNWASTCFSHHQKSIIVDSCEVPSRASGIDNGYSHTNGYHGEKRRRLVAFVGGLDLTDGRWDNQQHSLFSTLKSFHMTDFYQKCFALDKNTGPREPWHDVHAKVEGPAAYDVLRNFEERWRMQAKKKGDMLINIHSDEFLPADTAAPLDSVKDKWRVQLLRSINADSASFISDKLRALVSQKGKKTEDSIHRAYVHHIRRAKKFIYIENQYFLGSSHEWLNDASAKARHLIPLELANAVCEKIKKGERFAIYVIVPMFPEGDPHSAVIQEILFWQFRTIEMMYDRIGKAIRAAGIDAKPTDYLNFYCLGNREPGDLHPELGQPQANSIGAKFRASRRHMIYVHSKMMIVDDEVIILGSANINQRSMGGNRDTEIAICAHQPYHTVDFCDGRLPRCDVYAFRTALWAEHINHLLPEFNDPSSLECVRAVNAMAKENWERYNGNDVVTMEGHLMTYPLLVHPDGTLAALPDCPNFPDTTASIVGRKSTMFPMSLTT